jgi:two-component system response regulator FlrC
MASASAHERIRRILVVDDDESLLQAVVLAFRESGHEVVASSTFEEARTRLRGEAFDVLLTDVRLGAFNGLQLAVIARAANPKMRVLVFSGFDDPVLREEARQLGAAYLVKPVTSRQLLEIINAD